MSTTYPASKQTFTDPAGTSLLTGVDHAQSHTNINDTLEAVQDTIGTTLGTNVLKNFAAGNFPARVNAGGTIVQTLTGGTINQTVLGTPAITGGTITNPLLQGVADGWVQDISTWAYLSGSVFTGPSDMTTKIAKGDKVKIVQGGTTKFFSLIGSGGTVGTVAVNNDYVLENAAISSNYYSKASNPLGFPHWFGYDPTWTGFATAPTNDQFFRIEGNTVFMLVAANAVSNSSTLNFTLPVVPATLPGDINIPIAIVDNNNRGITPGVLGVISANLTAKVGTALNTAAGAAYAGFATANTKGLEAQFNYKM